jgi:hypothetical protein
MDVSGPVGSFIRRRKLESVYTTLAPVYSSTISTPLLVVF